MMPETSETYTPVNFEDPWYTISQVAAILKAKRSVVKRLHSKGILCGVKHGTTLLFHKDDIDRFMKGKRNA